MQPFVSLPFWQEFGILFTGTVLLFIFILWIDSRVRKTDKPSNEKTPNDTSHQGERHG